MQGMCSTGYVQSRRYARTNGFDARWAAPAPAPAASVFRFRTCMCEHGSRCQRPICFFAHTPEEVRPLPQGQRVALEPGGSRKAKEAAAAAAAAHGGGGSSSSSNSPAPSLQHQYSDPGLYMAAAGAVGGPTQMLYGSPSGGSMIMPDGSIATIPASGGGGRGVLVGGDQVVQLLQPVRTADPTGAGLVGQSGGVSTDVSPSLSPRWMAGQGLADGSQHGGLSPGAVSPVFHQQQQAGGLILQGSPSGSLYAPLHVQYMSSTDQAAAMGGAVVGPLMGGGQDATAYQLSGAGADMLQPGMANLTMVPGGGPHGGSQQHRRQSPGAVSPVGSPPPGAGGVGLGFAVIDGQPVVSFWAGMGGGDEVKGFRVRTSLLAAELRLPVSACISSAACWLLLSCAQWGDQKQVGSLPWLVQAQCGC